MSFTNVAGTVLIGGNSDAGDSLLVQGRDLVDDITTIGPDPSYQGRVQVDPALAAFSFWGLSSVAVDTGDETASDTIVVTPLGIPITIDGGDPVYPTLPGDMLILDPQGAAGPYTVTLTGQGAGLIQVDGLGPITYGSIETLAATVPLDLVINANADPGGDNVANDGQADEFLLVLNAAGQLEVHINGDLAGVLPGNLLNSVVVQGSSDDDTLTIDHDGGLILPLTGIFFDGAALGANAGPNGDLLNLVGDPALGALATEWSVATGPNSGYIAFDPDGSLISGLPGGANGDEEIIQYANLTPVNDTVPVFTAHFFATAGVDEIVVGDGPVVGTDQTLRITSVNATFEEQRLAQQDAVDNQYHGRGRRRDAGLYRGDHGHRQFRALRQRVLRRRPERR